MTQTVDRSVSALAEPVDYLARAKAVARVVEQEADAIERDATITRPVYEALAEAELFWTSSRPSSAAAGWASCRHSK